jgi:hypothetical protein
LRLTRWVFDAGLHQLLDRLGDRLTASASDCPVSAYGITLYCTLDLNATYLNEGVGKSPSADKVNCSIQRNACESKWPAGHDGLSTSMIGHKMKEEVLPGGWSLIGILEAGVNPYFRMLYNGPRSLAGSNARPVNTSVDSSRADRGMRMKVRAGTGRCAHIFTALSQVSTFAAL